MKKIIIILVLISNSFQLNSWTTVANMLSSDCNRSCKDICGAKESQCVYKGRMCSMNRRRQEICHNVSDCQCR